MTDQRFKSHRWDNPNKMRIESEYETFNKQCECISTGNVYGTCQLSSYIRPWNEVDNYGYTGKPGQFLQFDMQHFKVYYGKRIREIIYDPNRTESVILYQIRVWEDGQQVVIGYILTDKDYNLLAEKVVCEYRKNIRKRRSALNEVKNYVVAGWWKEHEGKAA